MNTPLTPASVRPPFGRYHHGVATPAGSRFIFTSGQLGVRADDSVPETIEEQAEVCFEAIRAILAEGGMSLADIVRLSAFVTKREDMRRYMSVRDRYVSDPPPASTLFIVSGFTRPEFLVEIEAVAARAD
ncbi:Enamine deaminase RidA, house cleaning of reactive enamine intermediates, YjgF/YER057c/UK114 family [Kaistia soli DSM 19436]|uniref:Enamine deaminase RidA, house cleaning of reactive enamine intermediates, YjgF/YER057c/UK114 family n=1 Tax=Kaistia soli DSM 19436 TaxID=1122133 RepID=A0A1M5J9Y0_9HYPH|nr:RidA family protein [Kaistia soli]SHG37372.1 Enamine deaminase RidA, house cleaning of reactive enamine intermediates, YjgF/YER057c/UK114 family [Kaistia soli DSM 19436]